MLKVNRCSFPSAAGSSAAKDLKSSAKAVDVPSPGTSAGDPGEHQRTPLERGRTLGRLERNKVRDSNGAGMLFVSSWPYEEHDGKMSERPSELFFTELAVEKSWKIASVPP